MSEPSSFLWIRQAEQKHRWRYPISATINGEEVIVWEDWIEYEADSYQTPYEPDYESDYE